MSTRYFLLRSTKPSKGWDTSAMIKSRLHFFVAKHSGMVHTLYVLIVLPLAATSEGPGCLVQVSNFVVGKTLTSAPVSTRNQFRDVFPHMKFRPSLRPDVEAATATQPAHFPTMHMVSGTGKPITQMGGGICIGYRQ